MQRRTIDRIIVQNQVLTLVETTDATGASALELRDAFGGPLLTLSLTTTTPLAPHEVAIDGDPDYADITAAAMATGFFEVTGGEVVVDDTPSAIWRIRETRAPRA